VTTEKRAPAKRQPDEFRKPQTRGCARENVSPRHNFVVELKGRITRSKAKVLGKEHQMLSPFVITLV